MIMMRKQKKERKDAKVTLDEIRSDGSPGKITSHQRITAILAKFGDAGLVTTYQKAELHTLCNAYGARFTRAMKKKDVGKLLADSILKFTEIPYPMQLAGNLRSEPIAVRIGEENKIKIRIFSDDARV